MREGIANLNSHISTEKVPPQYPISIAKLPLFIKTPNFIPINNIKKIII